METPIYHSCIICGAAFEKMGSAKTCSKNCSDQNRAEYAKKWYRKNKTKHIENMKKLQNDNKEHFYKMQSRYRTENSEKRKEIIKEWSLKNRDYHSEYSRKRRLKILAMYEQAFELGFVEPARTCKEKEKIGIQILNIIERNEENVKINFLYLFFKFTSNSQLHDQSKHHKLSDHLSF